MAEIMCGTLGVGWRGVDALNLPEDSVQRRPLESGDLLGRYRIDALLGMGGMGAVYRAYDPTLKRPLAIKILNPQAPGTGAHTRLLREARSASALNHPSICTVYEVGEEGGR